MKKFYFQENYYRNIEHKSGVYLLKFPNGMGYIGSSGDIKKRLGQHLNNFFTPYKVHNQWYIDAKTCLVNEAKRKHIDFKMACYTEIGFFVQYTDNLELARDLEQIALKEIKKNCWCDKYYNTQF